MKIPKRIGAAVINSLKGGVVPRVGLPYIAVGREKEIEAFLHDVDIICDGGAAFRFVVGKYGSGKSFLLQTVRNYVMDRGFVVCDGDLSPERRLQGTKGQGLATYKELVANMATKTRPEGGALTLILDRWISSIRTEAATESGLSESDAEFSAIAEKKIRGVVGSLSEMVHGFDFANLLIKYYRATVQGDDETKSLVLKWFRGEFSAKSEARALLGINIIITDDDWYEYIKLFCAFLKRAGYSGLYIMIDELVNIYKIPNAITRQYNYEKILTMYNDALQGKARYLGVIMSATPQCIEDTRRGVFSYEALRSRLCEGRISREMGGQDMLAPIIRLSPLNNEEMLILCEKLSEIHAVIYGYERFLTVAELSAFIKSEYSRVGAESHMTPREIIRDFIELLNILYQTPGADINAVLCAGEFCVKDCNNAEEENAAFAEFEI